MKYLVGFIGAGNMGGALAQAVCRSVDPENVAVCDALAEKAVNFANSYGCSAVNIETIISECKYIFLGVKPQVMPSVLQSIAPLLKARKDRFVLVSMAAGLTISSISEMAGDKYPIIRIMPNMPAAVGEAMVLYTCCPAITDLEKTEFIGFMNTAGKLAELPENLIDAGCAVSGCGPAYAFLFIEALADGGVKAGLSRDIAYELAAQTVIGAGKMVLETGIHPGALKDAVCSPGGTTIEAVSALETFGMRAAVMNAVDACVKKAESMHAK